MRYLVSMLRLWFYEYLNDRFGQVGDVGIMCPATIFKLLGIANIRNTSLWNYIYVFMHGITLHDYHGIITCWNVLKLYA